MLSVGTHCMRPLPDARSASPQAMLEFSHPFPSENSLTVRAGGEGAGG
jgi:hypothetical protein